MVDRNIHRPTTNPAQPFPTHFLLSVTIQGQWCFFRLNQDHHTVGRGSGSTIRIKHPGVSRQHAVIFQDDSGQFKLVDGDGSQPSGNGTFVNGHPIQECWVNLGDVIHFGSMEVKAQIEKIGTRSPYTPGPASSEKSTEEASNLDEVPTFLELLQAVDLAKAALKRSD